MAPWDFSAIFLEIGLVRGAPLKLPLLLGLPRRSLRTEVLAVDCQPWFRRTETGLESGGLGVGAGCRVREKAFIPRDWRPPHQLFALFQLRPLTTRIYSYPLTTPLPVPLLHAQLHAANHLQSPVKIQSPNSSHIAKPKSLFRKVADKEKR